MSGFKDMVEADIKRVFANPSEFAKLHSIVYDGVTYSTLPVVLSGIR